jgi:UDP-glucuronate 4-epimerase
MLRDKKIVVTGVTGMVALPMALALAEDNEVWGVARFSDPDVRARLEAAGVRCVTVDFVDPDLSEVPDDADHVLNFMVHYGHGTEDFDLSLQANAEGVGLLMRHSQRATSFLHCSATSVYAQQQRPLLESDPLGDNHRRMNPTYSISKIAAEAAARTCARIFDLPTTIARLNVPYSDEGGWMRYHLQLIMAGEPVTVYSEAPVSFSPIHTDDCVAQLPGLLAAASVPATVVNWAGPEQVSIQEWSTYMGELVGKPVSFAYSETQIEGVMCDTTKLFALAGPTTVDWHDGVRRLVANAYPDAV